MSLTWIIILSIGWAINFVFACLMRKGIDFGVVAVATLLVPYSVVVLVLIRVWEE